MGKKDFLPHIKESLGRFVGEDLSKSANLDYDSIAETAYKHPQSTEATRLLKLARAARNYNDERTINSLAKQAKKLDNSLVAAEEARLKDEQKKAEEQRRVDEALAREQEAARLKAEQDKVEEQRRIDEERAREEAAIIAAEQEQRVKQAKHNEFVARAKEREQLVKDYEGSISAQDADKLIDVKDFDALLNNIKREADNILDDKQRSMLNEQWNASSLRSSRVAALENAGFSNEIRDSKFMGKKDFLPHIKESFGKFIGGDLSKPANLAYNSIVETATKYPDSTEAAKLLRQAKVAKSYNDERTISSLAKEAQKLRNSLAMPVEVGQQENNTAISQFDKTNPLARSKGGKPKAKKSLRALAQQKKAK